MKHTKGPWVLKKKFFNDEYLDINTEIGNIGSVNTVQAFLRGNLASEFKVSGVTEEMCKANANLIAAAPEMLEALEALNCKLTELNSENKLNGLGLDKLIRRAFDVTEKARGDS